MEWLQCLCVTHVIQVRPVRPVVPTGQIGPAQADKKTNFGLVILSREFETNGRN